MNAAILKQQPIVEDTRTITERLLDLGITHKPSTKFHGARELFDVDGKSLGDFTACDAVEAFLRGAAHTKDIDCAGLDAEGGAR